MQHTKQVQHTKQGKPGTEFPLSNPLGEMFAQNANLWFATHAELLANVDALTHAWLNRRREGVDSMREAIQQMTECRDPAEMLTIQQDWLSGAFRRASEDVAMLNERIASMTQKATSDFEKVVHKVAAPLHTVSEEMRQGAGNKPHGGASTHSSARRETAEGETAATKAGERDRAGRTS